MFLRYRRYRIYVVFALAALYLFYSLSGSNRWGALPYTPSTFRDSSSGTSVESKDAGATTGESVKHESAPAFDIPDAKTDTSRLDPLSGPKRTKPKQRIPPQHALTSDEDEEDGEDEVEEDADKDADKDADEDEEEDGDEDKADEEDEEDADDEEEESQAPHRMPTLPYHSHSTDDEDFSGVHWEAQKEYYPVSTTIKLPTGTPKAIPKIQHKFTKKESATAKTERQTKLELIKTTFKHAWDGYKENAWMDDELSPVSGSSKNPFCGWAATLVDSLDSLWILGLKGEFDEATKAVAKIDFTTARRDDIPVFETVIRYLGGLLAAYDVSGEKYEILLQKAVELAEVIMGAFDTPNRMPETYYHWKPFVAGQKKTASTNVVLAELGSLSMEFTRLAQLTKENKYYDAIARITDALEKAQGESRVPGLWPTYLDASGCLRPDAHIAHSKSNAPTWAIARADLIKQNTKAKQMSKAKREALPGPLPPRNKTPFKKADEDIEDDEDEEQERCINAGLVSPTIYSMERFTLGGLADSTYEYLPKQFLLLGGQVSQYRKMYEDAADAMIKHLMYRPMLPNQDLDLRMTGILNVPGFSSNYNKNDKRYLPYLDPEGAHLTCFAGGMFGMSAKIFNRKEDLALAEKLTNFCIWAYNSTATGIMPESFRTIPCTSVKSCAWNETFYHEALDPNGNTRQEMYLNQLKIYKEGLKELAEEDAMEKTTESTSGTLQKTLKKDADEDEEEEEEDDEEEEVDAEEDEEEEDEDEDEEDAGVPPAAKIGKRQLKSSSTPTKTSKAADEDEDEDEDEEEVEDSKEIQVRLAAKGIYKPTKPLEPEAFIKTRIEEERLPPGFVSVDERHYSLRPEAIESIFYMYRLTGDPQWRSAGWKMFESIRKVTRSEFGASAIGDVTRLAPRLTDKMESFWLAETLKYFYLLFDDEERMSLDDWVLNTEAHPFRRPDSRLARGKAMSI